MSVLMLSVEIESVNVLVLIESENFEMESSLALAIESFLAFNIIAASIESFRACLFQFLF